jgi:hypothetical protein
MSYTYLQEQGEESSAECFSDIEQSVRLKLNLTAGKSSCSDNETESCRGSQFGTMCEPSTESRGEELQTLCVEGSPAKILAAPEMVMDWKENEAGYGKKCDESFAKYDHDTRLWRTAQCLLLGGLEEYSETWPKWGLMQDGAVYQRHIWEPRMGAIGFGYLPTPCKSDGTQSNKSYRRNTQTWENSSSLTAFLLGRMFGLSGDAPRPKGRFLVMPRFVQWMMAWPDGWTSLQPLGMDKYLLWQQAHGEF